MNSTNWDNGVPTSSDNAYIANGGTATINATGAVSSDIYLGNTTGSGSIQMTGGTLSPSGTEYVGYSGGATFTQSGGVHTIPSAYTNYLLLAFNTGTNATYNLSGTGQLSAPYEFIGYNGTGDFTQSGGSNSISLGRLSVGGFGTGSYSLSGGQLSAPYEIVGDWSGAGKVTQSGGTNTVSNQLVVGYGYTTSPEATGNYCLSAGAVSAPSEVIGYTGTGTFTQTGGTHVAGPLTFGLNAGASGTYTLNGGTLTTSALSVGGGSVTFNFGGGTLKASDSFAASFPMSLTGNGGNATVDTATQSITFAGQLSGSGGLKITGGGILTLSGANLYQGPTTVTDGTLNVANTTGSATGSGATTVEAAAALTGSGTIAGPLTIAGTLSPGNSAGMLTVNNQVTFEPGAMFLVDVNGLQAGTGYDQLSASGAVSLAGTLALTFGSFTPSGHDILFLVDNTGAQTTTGTFQYADNAFLGTFNGYAWYITYDAQNGAVPSLVGGNDVAIYTLPEPGSIVLGSMGLVGVLGGWLSRKQRGPQRPLQKRPK